MFNEISQGGFFVRFHPVVSMPFPALTADTARLRSPASCAQGHRARPRRPSAPAASEGFAAPDRLVTAASSRVQPPESGSPNPQAEALEQLRNALELKVMAVARAERSQLIRETLLGLGRRSETAARSA